MPISPGTLWRSNEFEGATNHAVACSVIAGPAGKLCTTCTRHTLHLGSRTERRRCRRQRQEHQQRAPAPHEQNGCDEGKQAVGTGECRVPLRAWRQGVAGASAQRLSPAVTSAMNAGQTV